MIETVPASALSTYLNALTRSGVTGGYGATALFPTSVSVTSSIGGL